MIKAYTNLKEEACLHVNSGTWEDQKTRDKNVVIDQDVIKMDFVVIDPVGAEKKTLLVKLCQYKYGKHALKDIDLVEL
jgi:hypothetical protein